MLVSKNMCQSFRVRQKPIDLNSINRILNLTFLDRTVRGRVVFSCGDRKCGCTEFMYRQHIPAYRKEAWLCSTSSSCLKDNVCVAPVCLLLWFSLIVAA
jgi:hypothetical protein